MLTEIGMMNNGWYTVKLATSKSNKLLIQHPYDQSGTSGGGWMKPSVANQLAAAKQDSGVPDKQFTREEIEQWRHEFKPWNYEFPGEGEQMERYRAQQVEVDAREREHEFADEFTFEDLQQAQRDAGVPVSQP